MGAGRKSGAKRKNLSVEEIVEMLPKRWRRAETLDEAKLRIPKDVWIDKHNMTMDANTVWRIFKNLPELFLFEDLLQRMREQYSNAMVSMSGNAQRQLANMEDTLKVLNQAARFVYEGIGLPEGKMYYNEQPTLYKPKGKAEEVGARKDTWGSVDFATIFDNDDIDGLWDEEDAQKGKKPNEAKENSKDAANGANDVSNGQGTAQKGEKSENAARPTFKKKYKKITHDVRDAFLSDESPIEAFIPQGPQSEVLLNYLHQQNVETFAEYLIFVETCAPRLRTYSKNHCQEAYTQFAENVLGYVNGTFEIAPQTEIQTGPQTEIQTGTLKGPQTGAELQNGEQSENQTEKQSLQGASTDEKAKDAHQQGSAGENLQAKPGTDGVFEEISAKKPDFATKKDGFQSTSKEEDSEQGNGETLFEKLKKLSPEDFVRGSDRMKEISAMMSSYASAVAEPYVQTDFTEEEIGQLLDPLYKQYHEIVLAKRAEYEQQQAKRAQVRAGVMKRIRDEEDFKISPETYNPNRGERNKYHFDDKEL